MMVLQMIEINSLDDWKQKRRLIPKNCTPKIAHEWFLLIKLLDAIVFQSFLKFPFSIQHRGEDAPDFEISSPNASYSIEVTNICSPNLGLADSVHHKYGMGTMMVTQVQALGLERKPKKEVLDAAYELPQEYYPQPAASQIADWVEQTLCSIDRKLTIRSQSRFKHGDEDWLLLWDETGTTSCLKNAVLELYRSKSLEFWSGGFEKVFILSRPFKDLWMINPKERPNLFLLG
jgi:hypothetical protein